MADDLKCIGRVRSQSLVERLKRRDQQETVLDTVPEIKLFQTEP